MATSTHMAAALEPEASGLPTPYVLYGVTGEPVGFLSTPSLRLALNARAAKESGRTRTPGHATAQDADPLYGAATFGKGLWYVALRLDSSYSRRAEYDLDLVLVSAADARQGRRADRIATPSEMPLQIGPGLALRSWGLGIDGTDAIYLFGGLEPSQLEPPVHVLAVDRVRSDDGVIVEGLITERDVAAWK